MTEADQEAAIRNVLNVLEPAPDVEAALVYTLVDRPPDDRPAAEEGFGVIRRGPEFEKAAYCWLANRRGAIPSLC
jgi:hypothetical protein